jgi:two-component system nitrate/nitrite response regulator NarL
MYGDIQVVAEAASGAEGIEAVLTHRPDVALVDLHMKGLDGISVVRALQTAGSATRLVMLTVSDSSFDVMEALKAGASGYLLKDMEPDEFCLKLRQVAAGARCCRPRWAASRQAPAPSRESIDAGWASSPCGSRRPWSWCRRGFQQDRGPLLGIAESTVKVHVKHVLQKLNLRNRFEAAVWLRELREERNA